MDEQVELAEVDPQNPEGGQGIQRLSVPKTIVEGTVGDAASIFIVTDFGILGMPHILGHAEDPMLAEVIFWCLVAEAGLSTAARVMASWKKAVGEQSDALNNLPLQIVGGIHIGMAGIFAANGHWLEAGIAGAFGIADFEVTGIHRGMSARIGEWNRQSLENAPTIIRGTVDYAGYTISNSGTFFTTGLLCVGALSSDEIAIAMAAPLLVATGHTIRNTKEQFIGRLPFAPDHGLPKIWYGVTTAAAGLVAVESLGWKPYAEGMKDTFAAVVLQKPPETPEEAVQAQGAAVASATLAISVAYFLMQRKFHNTDFVRMFERPQESVKALLGLPHNLGEALPEPDLEHVPYYGDRTVREGDVVYIPAEQYYADHPEERTPLTELSFDTIEAMAMDEYPPDDMIPELHCLP